MTPVSPPIVFDPAQVCRNRDRASSGFREYAFLKGRESNQLLERMADTSREFARALDIGAHDGQACEAIRASGKVKEIIALEAAPRMCETLRENGFETVRSDIEKLPFPTASFDLVTSVLSLHWINDLPGVLHQVREILMPDGLFLACLFGGGTLAELRASLIEAENEITGGISPRLSPLPGLQDMAGLLQRAGFALPVADVERVTVRYRHPMNLLQDLKGMGEQAAFAKRDGQDRRPLSRRILARMSEIYMDRFSDPDGKVRATFEVVWLSGWGPHSSQPKPLKPGSGQHSLAEAVRRARDQALD